MLARTRLLPLLPLLAVAAIAGCGSSDGAQDSDRVVVPAETTNEAAAPVGTSSYGADVRPTRPKGGGHPVSGAATPVESTPSGDLPLGSFATIAHEEYLGGGFVQVPLRVAVTRIDAGKASDLDGFPLQGDARDGTPYYVHARFQNLSRRTFNATGIAGGLTVVDTGGATVKRLDLIGDFTKCRATGDRQFGPGERTATCDVFLVPKGRTLGSVRYSDKYGAQYIWTAAK